MGHFSGCGESHLSNPDSETTGSTSNKCGETAYPPGDYAEKRFVTGAAPDCPMIDKSRVCAKTEWCMFVVNWINIVNA